MGIKALWSVVAMSVLAMLFSLAACSTTEGGAAQVPALTVTVPTTVVKTLVSTVVSTGRPATVTADPVAVTEEAVTVTADPVTETVTGPAEPTEVTPVESTAGGTARMPTRTLNGSGDDVVSIPASQAIKVVRFRCDGCDGNVSVKTADDLLVNEIGAYAGRTLIDTESDSSTTQFEIHADADWTMVVEDLRSYLAAGSGAHTSGHGDDVIALTTSPTKAAISHNGEGNFTVWAYYGSHDNDLLVNEIGVYSGTVALESDELVILEIGADGDWSVKAS